MKAVIVESWKVEKVLVVVKISFSTGPTRTFL